MKAKEFIFEAAGGFNIKNSDELDEALSIIDTQCSKALSTYRDTINVLWRGIGPGLVLPDLVKLITKQRRPRDTPEEQHEYIVNLFKTAGFEANRNNSIFTTSNHDVAEEYGQAYIVFPVNGFNFTWSPEIEDLWTDYLQQRPDFPHSTSTAQAEIKQSIRELSRIYRDFLPRRLKDISDIIAPVLDKIDPSVPNIISTVLKMLGKPLETLANKSIIEDHQTQDIRHLLRIEDVLEELLKFINQFKTNEVQGNVFIHNLFMEQYRYVNEAIGDALSYLANVTRGLKELKAKKKSPKNMIRDLGYKNTDFNAAVDSGHEVLIQGEYWLMNYEKLAASPKYVDLIEEFLGFNPFPNLYRDDE